MNEVIKKREVFYIHGHDPRGARFYHALYKEHLLKQNTLNHLNASVSKRNMKDGNASWDIVAYENQVEIHTKYNFVKWSDIILEHWANTLFEIVITFFYMFKTHILSGLILKYAKYAPNMVVNLLYMTFYFLFVVLVTYGSVNIFYELLSMYIPQYVTIPIGLFIGYFIFKFGINFGNKIAVWWLANIFAFPSKWSRSNVTNIDEKIETVSLRILKVLEENTNDEVLVVAHSTGVMFSVSIIVNLLKKCKAQSIDTSKLKLLSLAGSIPLISFQKDADFFRQDLKYLLEEKKLVWLDYTSKVDGLCFAMLDVNTMFKREDKSIDEIMLRGPILLSPKFHKLYEKKFYQYHKNRYKWFEIHFWYLMSTDYAGVYDYFQITAGSQPLENKTRK